MTNTFLYHSIVLKVAIAVLTAQEGKARKPVERRESTRLQSAAKLLRSLSKSKEVSKPSPAPPPEQAEQPAEPGLAGRGHPAYLSEGKGAGRKRGSGKEGREVRRGKDRAHSFHGKADRQRGLRGPGRDCTCEEKVVQGARSILLTEENLVPIRSAGANCCTNVLYRDVQSREPGQHRRTGPDPRPAGAGREPGRPRPAAGLRGRLRRARLVGGREAGREGAAPGMGGEGGRGGGQLQRGGGLHRAQLDHRDKVGRFCFFKC